MKFPTKVRYGLRFLMDLAMHEHAGNIKLKDIAQRQGISEKYLWQVVAPLKAAAMIRAEAGPGGGYQLARSSNTITLRDILVILEGDGGGADCTADADSCSRSIACAARLAWAQLDEAVNQAAQGISLSSLVARQRELESGASLNYVI